MAWQCVLYESRNEYSGGVALFYSILFAISGTVSEDARQTTYL